MATYNLTEKQILGPIPVSHGSLITVTPSSGGSTSVEYSKNQYTVVYFGSPTWVSWPIGNVSAVSQDVVKRDCFMRFTATTGTAIITIEENGAVPDYSDNDWHSIENRNASCSVRITSQKTIPALGTLYVPWDVIINETPSGKIWSSTTPTRLTVTGGYSNVRVSAQVEFAGPGAMTNPSTGAVCYMPPYPGAERSIQMWAAYNWASDPVIDSPWDSRPNVPGPEATVTRYTTCRPGGAVELWTINGGGHGSAPSSEFSPRVLLAARPSQTVSVWPEQSGGEPMDYRDSSRFSAASISSHDGARQIFAKPGLAVATNVFPSGEKSTWKK